MRSTVRGFGCRAWIWLIALSTVQCREAPPSPSPAPAATAAPSAIGSPSAEVVPAASETPPTDLDSDVSAAITALAAHCRIDLLHGVMSDCDAEEIGFERSLALCADDAPLRSLYAALGGEDERARIAAANLVERRVRGCFERLASAGLPKSEALRWIARISELPPTLSLRAVRAAAYAASIGGAVPELCEMLDAHPHAATRRGGYGHLVALGGVAGFERARAFAERSNDPRHADRRAVLDGLREGGRLSGAEEAAVCPWLAGSLEHDVAWVAGLASARLGRRCGGEWIDALLTLAQKRRTSGELAFEMARDMREMCAFSPDRPALGSTRQCDAFVDLMVACADDARLSDDARAACIDNVVRLRHDDAALALARRFAGHRSERIRRRAEESVYWLMGEPHNLK